MQRVGALEFTLKGQQLSLGAFVEAGRSRSRRCSCRSRTRRPGKETYSAGPYLDIQPTATGLYTIDFNNAYNPYCAYNATYECPYPPPSNRLKVRDPRRRKGAAAHEPCAAGDRLRLRRRHRQQRAAAPQGLSAGARRRRHRAVSADEYFARYLGYDDVGVFEALARDRGIADERTRRSRRWSPARATSCRSCCVPATVLFPGATRVHPRGGGRGADRHRLRRAAPRDRRDPRRRRHSTRSVHDDRRRPATRRRASRRRRRTGWRSSGCSESSGRDLDPRPLRGHRGFAVGTRVGARRRPALCRRDQQLPGATS